MQGIEFTPYSLTICIGSISNPQQEEYETIILPTP
jgi:hypothetical protein